MADTFVISRNEFGVELSACGASTILTSVVPFVIGPFSIEACWSVVERPFMSEPTGKAEPSTTPTAGFACSEDSSAFHQRGLDSTLQRAHLRSDRATGDSLDSSLIFNPALEWRALAEVGVDAVIADALRLPWIDTVCDTVRVDWSTKFALRAVPVSVRSACLNSRAKSCRAIRSVPSTTSFIG